MKSLKLSMEEKPMDKENGEKNENENENEYQSYQQQIFLECLQNAKDIVAEHKESIDVFHLALEFFKKTCSTKTLKNPFNPKITRFPSN